MKDLYDFLSLVFALAMTLVIFGLTWAEVLG